MSFAIKLPRSLLVGKDQLACIRCVALLLDADVDWWWPVDATTFSVVPSCRHVVVGLTPLAGGACVVRAGWMEPVRPTVAAHAAWHGVLGGFTFGAPGVSFATAVTAGATAVAAVWNVFFDGHRFCELGNLV